MRFLNPLLLLVALIAIAINDMPSFAHTHERASELRLITTYGEVEVKVIPDLVRVTIGVQGWDKDLERATESAKLRARKVANLSAKYEIEPNHVQTGRICVEPTYSERQYGQKPNGYSVRQDVTFVLSKPDTLQILIADAIGAGGNAISNLDFDIQEKRKYGDQARKLAVRAAREKAADMAAELGGTIGRPYEITETEFTPNACMSSSLQGASNGSIGPDDSGTGTNVSSISPGEIAVTAKVKVSFELN